MVFMQLKFQQEDIENNHDHDHENTDRQEVISDVAKIEKSKEVWKNYEIKCVDAESGLYEAVEFNIFNRVITRLSRQ